MAKYLVTGAAGFIGSALARKLINDGHRVVTIDNLSTGFMENIPEGCKLITGNAHDTEIIAKLHNEHFDAIFHIAGQSSGEVSYADPVYDLDSNVTSTLLLLDYARRTKCSKFIYASSMSVYGEVTTLPVTEETAACPQSFYAVGKIASEHYMRLFTQFGIKCVALRLNNVYGEGQNMENLQQGMASIFIAQAIKTGAVHVKGAKDRFRDFVYIGDAVNAFVTSEQSHSENQFRVYNVSTNVKTTVEELISLIQANLPSPVPVQYEGNTPGDQHGIYCSYSLIERELGWKPTVALADGIGRMVRWAVNNS